MESRWGPVWAWIVAIVGAILYLGGYWLGGQGVPEILYLPVTFIGGFGIGFGGVQIIRRGE